MDRKGFNVIAACLTEQGAALLSSGASHRLKTVLLDVTDAESIRHAGEFVSAEVGERGEERACRWAPVSVARLGHIFK